MTDTAEHEAKEPVQSPDFLAPPKRAKDVRRLNRRPLLIVGGLVSLAIVAITFTFFQRQAAMQGGARVQQETVKVPAPAVAPISPTRADGPPQMPTDYEMPTDQVAPAFPAEPGMPTDQVVPAIQNGTAQPISQEYEQRMRIIQRVEESKIQAWEAALAGETGVQNFNRAAKATPAAHIEQTDYPDPAASIDRLASLAAVNQGYGSAGSGMAMGSGFGESEPDPNRQDRKRAFLKETPDTDVYLKHTRQPAVAPTEVKAGTVIPGVMISGINSDLPGQIVGQVRQNVYDTATGNHLLIPAGARLIGTYDSTVTMGQRRVLIAWNRIIYPDGSSVSLDVMPGADESGYAGFRDKVDNHYMRTFGNALFLSLFSAGVQLSQPDSRGNEYSSQEILTAELGRQLGQLGMETARRNLNIQPTITIRPAYRFNMMVTKDMILPPWKGGASLR